MVFTLLETANQYFDNSFITAHAASLEEEETGVGKALYISIPTVLWGIVTQVTGGARQLTRQLVNEPGFASGESLLEQLFGKQLGEVTQAIITYSGVKSISAYTILAAAAPAVFTTVSQYAREKHMDEARLASILAGQQRSLTAKLPTGLPALVVIPEKLPDLSYLPQKAELPPEIIPDAEALPEANAPEDAAEEIEEPEEETPRKGRRKHWITLTAVTAGALAAWYFFKGNCNNNH